MGAVQESQTTSDPRGQPGGLVLSAQHSLPSDKAHCSLRRLDAALSPALGIVLALSPQQILRWSGFLGQPPSLTSEAGHRP